MEKKTILHVEKWVTQEKHIKSDGNGNKDAGQATTRAMVVATTVAVMRVASNKEGEGSKAMEMVTRLAGDQWQQ